MLESPEERGKVTQYAKELGIHPRTAKRWWDFYKETEEVPYKQSKTNNGAKSAFKVEHQEYIKELLDEDPQLFAEDIIESLTKQFMDFTISKTQLNHHLKNTMLITVKRPIFEPEVRNSETNLQTRYEWFMEWKDSDLDYTKNCIFIDEAGFHINLRNNWARSAVGTPAKVIIPKTKSPSHTIIGAIHSSSVIHVVLKKPPPKKEKPLKKKETVVEKKKRKLSKGKERAVGEIIVEEPTIEYVDIAEGNADENNKPIARGTTTAHFVKFMNELLDVMDLDESLKGSYLVMDNCSIHNSKPMIRKIESRGYRVMYLPPYSPELNPIEQFWAIVKGRLKRQRLMTEENLSSRIAEACNDIPVSNLYAFSDHSKRQIINCYNKTPF